MSHHSCVFIYPSQCNFQLLQHTGVAYEPLGAADRMVMVQADPICDLLVFRHIALIWWIALTTREVLTLHNEVLAMMDKEGLSYQVAVRQLYYTEVVKLESEMIVMKAFSDFMDKIDGH